MSADPTTPAPETPAEPMVARAGTYYRNARYIMFAIIVLMGAWFLYDGFVKYPEENRQYIEISQKITALEAQRNESERVGRLFDGQAELDRLIFTRKQEMKEHPEFSIRVQKILGFSLPPIGIALLVYWLRKSRGEISIADRVLNAPGNPPIPIDTIDELDKELWDKKGIAYAYYTLADGTTGKVRLDDFVYQARPIRAIVKQIEAELRSQDQVITEIKIKEQSTPTP